MDQAWRSNQGCISLSKKQFDLDGRASSDIKSLGFPKDTAVSQIKKLLMSAGEELPLEK